MSKAWKVCKEWCRVLIEATIIVGVLYLFMWPVSIDGASMENTLHHNDRVTISRFMAMRSQYEYGDLLVFDWTEYGKSFPVIKRIIAVEGDKVEIRDGAVFINGTLLDEPYAKGKTEGELSMTIPKEHVFVLGDNREHSNDSRYMGAIPQKSMVGMVLFRWFPLDGIRNF